MSPSRSRATIESEPTVRLGTPTLLFEAGELLVTGSPAGGRALDIDPTSGRFLMVTADSEAVVIQNWTEALKSLVPTDQ